MPAHEMGSCTHSRPHRDGVIFPTRTPSHSCGRGENNQAIYVDGRTIPVLLPGALRCLFLYRSLRSDTSPMLRILSTIRARERLAVIRFRMFPSTSVKTAEKAEIKDFAGITMSREMWWLVVSHHQNAITLILWTSFQRFHES